MSSPCKGVDKEGFVSNLVIHDLMWLGHLELILKGDNEPSLQAQIDATLSAMRIKASKVETNVLRISKESIQPTIHRATVEQRLASC